MQLTEFELEVFSRQLLIKGWGLKEQLSLKNSSVLIKSDSEILARYLLSAGIGHLFILSEKLFNDLKGFELNTCLELVTNLEQLDLEKFEVIDLKKHDFIEQIISACKTIVKLSGFNRENNFK